METYDQDDAVKQAVQQLKAAQSALKGALGKAAETNPKLKSIEMKGTARRSAGGRLELGCIIVVIGEDQEAAEEHCNDMQGQGCICSSTGPSTCQCDCSGVE